MSRAGQGLREVVHRALACSLATQSLTSHLDRACEACRGGLHISPGRAPNTLTLPLPLLMIMIGGSHDLLPLPCLARARQGSPLTTHTACYAHLAPKPQAPAPAPLSLPNRAPCSCLLFLTQQTCYTKKTPPPSSPAPVPVLPLTHTLLLPTTGEK